MSDGQARIPRVDVLMPTWGHEAFVERAVASLLAQTVVDWRLTIVDDASPDATAERVRPFLEDARIRYRRLPRNVGLGAALNVALVDTDAPLVAYLPSDDVWYDDHLQSLVDALDAHPEAVLAIAGVRHHYNRSAPARIDGEPLQLVQCMHRRGPERWTPRAELVTDDLDRMFWAKLAVRGSTVQTHRVTCEWVSHPGQLHRVLREPEGGINTYRSRFAVREPMRFHASTGNLIDEIALHGAQRSRPDTPRASDGLRILLVGELAYNADRVLALEEMGHELYGLWMEAPYWYNTVGPVPFGHVRDVDRANWRREVARIRPDVVYALLNWQAVPFAHHVMTHLIAAAPDIPFVWHFKEGPFICLEKGTWSALLDLYRHADGIAWTSPEMRDWFDTIVPGLSASTPGIVLDGDLPKRDWFEAPFSPKLSAADGEIHTVVPGRPIGLHPPDVAALASEGIHLHFYGDFTHGQWKGWIEKTRALAPRHLHLHPNVDVSGWVREFSRYDAGWLHFFASGNRGDLRRANWDDLNYPARIATLAAAGLPLLQRNNDGHLVATQTLARERGIGLFFERFDELGEQLRDAGRRRTAADAMIAQRDAFTFDHHAPRLVEFFRDVIRTRGAPPSSRRRSSATAS